MRGVPSALGRTGRPILPNEATARPYNHPAPYDGWNARGNLANMKPTEALQIDNIFPGVQNVTLRLGCIDWKTNAPTAVHALLPYTGLTTNKLFASTNAGIYDVTASGAFGAAASPTVTNGYWQSLMMATAGGNFLVAVNGTDAPISFDGATWAAPAITGVTGGASTLSSLILHQRRLWFTQKNTSDLWYLGTDSIAGAASKFPVGALFKKGGVPIALGTWTLDNGTGLDDYFVVASSAGELAIYQGTDPSSINTWSLVGVYDVARPLGTRPFLKYGGDLIYLSMIGIVPMSQLTQSTNVDLKANVSFNIDGAFLAAAQSYSGNLGWQMLQHKAASFILVNVPVAVDTSAVQFVMNTTTKKWCRFTGWNASCWAEFNGDIYFGSATKVSKAWVGTTDAALPIVGVVAQAYARYNSQLQSKVELARPNVGFTGAAQLQMAIDSDFRTFAGQTIFTYTPAGTGGIWDTSTWDNTTWDAGASLWEPKWTTVPGDVGYLHSFRLQITASSGNFIWTSTDFAVKAAGIIGS